MCCNPENGRVEFEDGWLIKPSFITVNDINADQDQYPKKTKKTLMLT
jgi:hypothetical protein